MLQYLFASRIAGKNWDTDNLSLHLICDDGSRPSSKLAHGTLDERLKECTLVMTNHVLYRTQTEPTLTWA